MRCTVVITSRQAAEQHPADAERYLAQRFLRDYGVEITGLMDPRLEFEVAHDDEAFRVTFDDTPKAAAARGER